jgi:hypothetical protein
MGKNCCLCEINTIFFYWSTSRNFPREALSKYLNIDDKYIEVPVCFKCARDKLGFKE